MRPRNSTVYTVWAQISSKNLYTILVLEPFGYVEEHHVHLVEDLSPDMLVCAVAILDSAGLKGFASRGSSHS